MLHTRAQRWKYFQLWLDSPRAPAPPAVLWLPAFSAPRTLLTAVLQRHVRQRNASSEPAPAQSRLEDLTFSAIVLTSSEAAVALQSPAADGVYVSGKARYHCACLYDSAVSAKTDRAEPFCC